MNKLRVCEWQVELRGTEQSRKAVLVTAGDDIGVYAMNSAERGSCDGSDTDNLLSN